MGWGVYLIHTNHGVTHMSDATFADIDNMLSNFESAKVLSRVVRNNRTENHAADMRLPARPTNGYAGVHAIRCGASILIVEPYTGQEVAGVTFAPNADDMGSSMAFTTTTANARKLWKAVADMRDSMDTLAGIATVCGDAQEALRIWSGVGAA